MKHTDLTNDTKIPDFSDWTLKRIREKGSSMNWMEERRYDWVPLTAVAIERIINARTVLLVTDREREWFARYTLTRLNKFNTQRPLLPIISLGTVFPYMDKIGDSEQLNVLEDMLSLAFPNDYMFFYIGKGSDPRAQIAKSNNESLLWLLDETAQNSFSLHSKDDELDIKLIQLLMLFDKSIDAILFSEVDIQSEL